MNNVTKVISLDDDVVIDPNYVHTENNFTNVYKNKLDGIQSGAEQNVQSDWLETDPDEDSFIRHKPVELASSLDAGTELIAGQNITLTNTLAGLVISANGGETPWTYAEDTTFNVTVTADDVTSSFFERLVPITNQDVLNSNKDFVMIYQCQVEADSSNPPSIPDMTPIGTYRNRCVQLSESPNRRNEWHLHKPWRSCAAEVCVARKRSAWPTDVDCWSFVHSLFPKQHFNSW